MSTTPSDWNVISNNGTALVAYSHKSGEFFNGTPQQFALMFRAESERYQAEWADSTGKALVRPNGTRDVYRLSAGYRAVQAGGYARSRPIVQAVAQGALGTTPTTGTVGYCNYGTNGNTTVVDVAAVAAGRTYFDWRTVAPPVDTYVRTEGGLVIAGGAISSVVVSAADQSAGGLQRVLTSDPEPMFHMSGFGAQSVIRVNGQLVTGVLSPQFGGTYWTSLNLRGLTSYNGSGLWLIEFQINPQSYIYGISFGSSHQTMLPPMRPLIVMITDSLGNTQTGLAKTIGSVTPGATTAFTTVAGSTPLRHWYNVGDWVVHTGLTGADAGLLNGIKCRVTAASQFGYSVNVTTAALTATGTVSYVGQQTENIYPRVVSDLLDAHVWAAPYAGSGYVVPGTGDVFSNRVPKVAAQLALAGIPASSVAAVVFAGGTNDGGQSAALITAGASAAISAAKATFINANVIMLGAWGQKTSTQAAATTIATENAIFAAATAAGGVFTVPVMTDPAGAWITGNTTENAPTGSATTDFLLPSGETVHWGITGHNWIGQRVAHGIAQALGL
jgi:hypothetical protein